MVKKNNNEDKKIILIFFIFGILALIIVLMLIKNGLFSTNVHFNHQPITYSIQSGTGSNARVCSNAQIERIDNAFEIIQNETQRKILFLKVIPGKEDISIFCAGIDNENLTYSINSIFKISSFTVTEGESQFSYRGKIIKKGAITFYVHRNCGTWPDVEIHEILHILGFGHTEDKTSIMYPISLICDRQEIDKRIIKKIIETYN